MSIMVNYAQLALKCGVNIQKGQTLVITGPIWTADFAHLLMEEAYKLGAKDVIIQYDDPEADRLRLIYADEETLVDVPRWMAECQTVYGDRGAAFMRLSSAKPGMLDGVDAGKMTLRQKALNAPVMDLKMKRMANDLSWTAVAVPNEAWAKQVYPALEEKAALAALWQAVYDCCYVTEESATDGWNAHMDDMQCTVKKLNGLKPRKIHLKNGLGTDLHLEMCEEGVFAGGIAHCPEPDGVVFAPNIPTEEILTTPHRFSANGTVQSTLPLVYNGSIVNNFCLTFKDGVVVDYTCETGADILEGILNTDEGSCRLGEVALVPYDSPIRKTGVLFYNTLFDENASCHLALGAGYIDVLHGADRSTEALVRQGLNVSLIHVDFMFGSADMHCTIETESGETVDIFRDGVFVI